MSSRKLSQLRCWVMKKFAGVSDTKHERPATSDERPLPFSPFWREPDDLLYSVIEHPLVPLDFGQLRSWMNQPELTSEQRSLLWQAVVMHSQENRQDYCTRWQPYIEGFAHHLKEPLSILTSLSQLERALDLLPSACFELQWNYCEIDDEEVQILASLPFLCNLNSLSLGNNRVEDEGAKSLASSPHLRALVSLNLHGNDIDDEGAIALASSAYLGGLTSLDLHGNRIGEDGAAALANSAYLSEEVRKHWRS